METQESTSYLTCVIKNVAFFIIYWGIFFTNLIKFHPDTHEWTPLLILDFMALPAIVIFLGYIFLYLIKVSGCLLAIIVPIAILVGLAYLVDTVIAKIGLPPNYWPYALGILGILLNVINIIKLIQNIQRYRLYKFSETHDL